MYFACSGKYFRHRPEGADMARISQTHSKPAGLRIVEYATPPRMSYFISTITSVYNCQYECSLRNTFANHSPLPPPPDKLRRNGETLPPSPSQIFPVALALVVRPTGRGD